MKLGQEAGHNVGVQRSGVSRGMIEDTCDVQLDAVASAEDDRFAVEARGERFERAGQLVLAEAEALAHGDGGIAMAATDGEEVHRGPPPRGCSRTMQNTSSTKAAMV